MDRSCRRLVPKVGSVSYTHLDVYKRQSGFRGEPYRVCKNRLCFFGDSFTFGYGVAESDTWCYHFREQYAKHLHFADFHDINLLNFGLPGASNQEISRNVVLQCSRLKANFAIMTSAPQDRSECVLDGKIIEIGPWTIKQKSRGAHIGLMSQGYYQYYTPELGALELMRNLLNAQFFFKANGIKYVLVSLIPLHGLSYPSIELLKLLESPRIIWLPRLLSKEARRSRRLFNIIAHDRASDGKHWGKSLHRLVGELIWEWTIKHKLL